MHNYDYANYRGVLYTTVGLLTLLRLVVAARVGLGDAEAYYWTWSQHLAWGYYDHGPIVAWCVRLGTLLLGDGPLGVRAPFILCSAVMMLLTAALTRRIYGDKPALAALAALLTMPMVLIAGGAANPDVPFATLVLLFVLLATSARPSLALAGLVAGVATSTKLFGLGLLVPLGWLIAGHRVRWRALLAGAGAFALGALPSLIWNLQHHGASLRYHLVTRHGAAALGLSIFNLGKLVAGQLAYVGPITVVASWAALLAARHRWAADARARLLLVTALPLLLGGALLILIVPSAEPHWMAAGYLPLLPLLAQQLVDGWTKRWVRGVCTAALALAVIVLALFHLHVMTDLGVRAAPSSYVPRYDISNELHGWPQVADAVTRELGAHRGTVGARPALAAGCHYTSCSQLRFAAKGRYEVLCPSPRVSQLDFFPGGDGAERRGIDLLYLRDERFPFDVETLYRCARVRRSRRVELARGGRVVRRFALQWCLDFAGLRATRWPPPSTTTRHRQHAAADR